MAGREDALVPRAERPFDEDANTIRSCWRRLASARTKCRLVETVEYNRKFSAVLELKLISQPVSDRDSRKRNAKVSCTSER